MDYTASARSSSITHFIKKEGVCFSQGVHKLLIGIPLIPCLIPIHWSTNVYNYGGELYVQGAGYPGLCLELRKTRRSGLLLVRLKAVCVVRRVTYV